MLQSDFMAHLARKGVLRDPHAVGGTPREPRRDSLADVDWVGLTNLTPSGFADELAGFYRCDRVQRRDLVGSRFAGAQLSGRFLKEEHLFPYEHPCGTLALAIARPVEDETIRAAEVALRQSVAIVVATADDIDAALATILETERQNTIAPAETATADDDLDDLRDLARGAPVVRALDELLRLAVEQRATDLHLEPLDNVLQVRLRIDGLLKPLSAPPMSMAKGLLSRLKIMAGVDITQRRPPQGGPARLVVGGTAGRLRLPTPPPK